MLPPLYTCHPKVLGVWRVYCAFIMYEGFVFSVSYEERQKVSHNRYTSMYMLIYCFEVLILLLILLLSLHLFNCYSC